MNYFKIYKSICKRGIIRIKDNIKDENYYELHHVFMKAIHGENNFISKLTAREHILAHKLLVKIYEKRYGINSRKFIKAAHAFRMVCMVTKNIKRNPTIKDLALCRELNSIANIGDNNPAKRPGVGKKISLSKTGKPRLDMKGKSFFGSNKNKEEIFKKATITRKINMDKLELEHGFRVKYPKNRKSREPNVEMNKKISATKSEHKKYIQSLSVKEFYDKIVKAFLVKHKPETESGKININFSKLFKCRNESIENYYEIARIDGCEILTEFIDRRIRKCIK